MELFSLTGKKAVVTGGASGLGLALVEGLHESMRAAPEWHRKVMDRVPIDCYGTPADLKGTSFFWRRPPRITSAG